MTNFNFVFLNYVFESLRAFSVFFGKQSLTKSITFEELSNLESKVRENLTPIIIENFRFMGGFLSVDSRKIFVNKLHYSSLM